MTGTITRGITFRCYDVSGLENTELSVEDGVIAHRVPDEIKTLSQAFVVAELFRRAAYELSSQHKPEFPDDGA